MDLSLWLNDANGYAENIAATAKQNIRGGVALGITTAAVPIIFAGGTPLTAAYALIGYVIGSFAQSLQKPMAEPQITLNEIPPYATSTKMANTGNDAVILVHDSWPFGKEALDAKALKKYLENKDVPFGVPVEKVHLVLGAEERDLEVAIKDPKVGSIAVFGHSSVGSWKDPTKEDVTHRVTYHNIAKWVEESGHYKKGFGLKAGCNVILNSEQRKKCNLPEDVGKYQLLAPAFPANLFRVKGYQTMGGGYEPGSETTFGLGKNPRLVQLIHAVK